MIVAIANKDIKGDILRRASLLQVVVRRVAWVRRQHPTAVGQWSHILGIVTVP